MLLVVATLGLWWAAPGLAPHIAPGMDAAQHAQLTHLVRIILPAQIFHVLGGLLSATLQARERHMMPALAPLLYTGGIVVFGVLLGPSLGAEGFAWGVLAGSFVGPFLLPLIACVRGGMRWSPVLSWRNADLRTYLWRSLPVMLGFSVVVFDDFLLRYFGSLVEEGTISRLTYAKTLMRVPMGVFGLAAGMATYPVLARLYAEGRPAEARETLVRALRTTLVLAIAAQAALTVSAPQIALVIWGQRRFTPEQLAEIGALTGWVCLGLWAWSTQGLVARGFYARGDTWTPTLLGSAGHAAVRAALLAARARVRRRRARGGLVRGDLGQRPRPGALGRPGAPPASGPGWSMPCSGWAWPGGRHRGWGSPTGCPGARAGRSPPATDGRRC